MMPDTNATIRSEAQRIAEAMSHVRSGLYCIGTVAADGTVDLGSYTFSDPDYYTVERPTLGLRDVRFRAGCETDEAEELIRAVLSRKASISYYLDGRHIDGWDESDYGAINLDLAARNLLGASDVAPGAVLAAELTVTDESGHTTVTDRQEMMLDEETIRRLGVQS